MPEYPLLPNPRQSLLLIIIFALVSKYVSGQCSVQESVFPMYLGGLLDETKFHQIDIDQQTENLALAGFSSDIEVLQGVTTGTSQFQRPIIMVVEKTNVIRWAIYLKDYSEAVSSIRYHPSGKFIVVVMENAPLKLFFISSNDGTLLGAKEQSHSGKEREARACSGTDCIQFSNYDGTDTSGFMYMSLAGTYTSGLDLNPLYCCNFPRDFSTACCTHRKWEIMKLSYDFGSSDLTLSINWSKISDREGKANVMAILDSGTQDELYVGGFLSSIDTSTNREYRSALTQFNGDNGQYRWGLSSNLQHPTNQYYTMTQIYAYTDSSVSQTFIYSCSADEQIQGFVGLHLFIQTTPNTIPTPDRSLIIGTDTDLADFNQCRAIIGKLTTTVPQNTHKIYVLGKLRTPNNPIIIELTILPGSFSVSYFQGNFDQSFYSLTSARFVQSISSFGRAYLVGSSDFTLEPSASQTGFSMLSGFIDSSDSLISCSGSNSVAPGDQPSIAVQSTAQFTTISPILTFTNNLSENNWVNTLDSYESVKTLNILDSYKCTAVTGPTIVLSTNKVIPPSTTGISNSGVIVYTVNNPEVSTLINDYTVQACAPGAVDTTLTYSLQTTPILLQTSGAITIIKDLPSSKLKFSIQSSDSGLIDSYGVTLKASLKSGEFATQSFTVNIVGGDCKSSGIKVTFGSTPIVPQAKLNLTGEKIRIQEGVRGYTESNGDKFYMPVLPYQIKPFNCEYTIQYNAIQTNGALLPSFIKLDLNLMRFEVNLSNILTSPRQLLSITGTYKIKIIATIDNEEKTVNEQIVWTLKIFYKNRLQQQQDINHPPHFSQSLHAIKVAVNESLTYSLPSIIDLDIGDTVKATVDLGQTITFVKFVPYSNGNSSYALLVKPTLASQLGNYEISITLTDNHSPLPYSQTYSLVISVVQNKSNETPHPQDPKNQTKPNTTFQIDPNLTAKIVDISVSGLVRIRFNMPLLLIANASQILSSPSVLDVRIKQSEDQSIQNWKVIDMTEQTLTLQVEFSNSEYIAIKEVREQLQIIFIDNQYFVSKATRKAIAKGSVVEKKLPPQMSQDDELTQKMQSVANVLQGTIVTAMFTNLLISIVLSSSTQVIWGLINSLQVIVHLPLLQFSFPTNVKVFCQIMAEAANFDFIPSSQFNDILLTRDPTNEVDNPFNDNFAEMGYDTVNFFDTLSDMFYYEIVFLSVTISVHVINRIYSKITAIKQQVEASSFQTEQQQYEGGEDSTIQCTTVVENYISKSESQIQRKRSCATKFMKAIREKIGPWIYQKIIFGALLRLFLEGYFEVCVATLPAIKKMSFDDRINSASSIMALLHLVFILVGYPIFIIVFFTTTLKQYPSNLASDNCQQRYGALFSELNFSDRRALAYHLLFLLRRFLLITQATFLTRDHQFFNILLLLFTSSCLLVYLLKVKPFSEPLLNKLEFFNEFIVLLVSVYHCLVYSDLAQLTRHPEEYQSQGGWTFIALIVLIQIPLNLIAIVGYNIREIWVKRKVIIGKIRLTIQKMSRKNEINSVVPMNQKEDLSKLQINNFVINETERDLMTAKRTEDSSRFNQDGTFFINSSRNGPLESDLISKTTFLQQPGGGQQTQRSGSRPLSSRSIVSSQKNEERKHIDQDDAMTVENFCDMEHSSQPTIQQPDRPKSHLIQTIGVPIIQVTQLSYIEQSHTPQRGPQGGISLTYREHSNNVMQFLEVPGVPANNNFMNQTQSNRNLSINLRSSIDSQENSIQRRTYQSPRTESNQEQTSVKSGGSKKSTHK